MRYKIYITVTAVIIISIAIGLLSGLSHIIISALCIPAIISIVLAYRAVDKPINAIDRGMDLLRSQDFSSRLRKTGQYDADNIISLFNRLMDTMKAERLKLEEQNLFLAKLMEVSPMGIAICDFDDNIVQTNPAFEKMCTPTLMGEISALAPDRTKVVRLGTSEVYRCSRMWFMDSGFRRTFYIIERLTDDIVESEQNVFRKIVRTIGHEVNNTLAPVVSVMESFADMLHNDSIATDAISSAISSCDNLRQFVSNYAAVVKTPRPCLQDTSLSHELHHMLPSLQALAPAGTTIEIDTDQGAKTVKVDMILIERAITNIIKNSVESIGSRPDGRIVIAMHGHSLTITDNGGGIDHNTAEHLFTPFFSTKQPDRGLGLMLVADILRAHHANFSLRTDPTTSLTTFTIDLPLHTPDNKHITK